MALLSETMVYEIVGIIVALIAVIYAYFKWIYQYWRRKGVPYLEPQFPIGNRHIYKNISFGDDIRQSCLQAKKNGETNHKPNISTYRSKRNSKHAIIYRMRSEHKTPSNSYEKFY